jgi:hypothetical protein
VDTIVCHTDFDGLCSAAKWIRGGVEPYAGADDDARAIDTRTAIASPIGQRFDRAIRGRSRDSALFGIIVRHLATGLEDASLWTPIDAAAAEFAPMENTARRVAGRYAVFEAKGGLSPSVAFVDATQEHGRYDKTLLLLLGQERAKIAVLLDLDTLTLAARYDSGLNFLELLGLSGGMPTLVSVQKTRLREAMERLGVGAADLERLPG